MRIFIGRVVEWSRRHARALVVLLLALTAAAAVDAASRITIDTDLDNLISHDTPWRQREAEMDRAFPQNANLMVVVIDADTPDQSEDAALALAAKLRAQPELFHNVRLPELNDFFRRNGLLFLSKDEVQSYADQMIAAQPFLGSLAADPSLRAVFDTITLMALGVQHGAVEPREITAALNGVQRGAENALAGRFAPLSWQTLLSKGPTEPHDRRKLILLQPTLDFTSLAPGERATNTIREMAKALDLTPDHGVRVRITGVAALSDDQLATLSEGAGFSAALSFGLLCLWLFLALRSLRIFIAIFTTLATGLIATTSFAVHAVGALNPISVAFAVLFVGIAVDFGIQFSVRYRDERYRAGDLAEALRRTAQGIGRPMTIAAAAAAAGFLAFVPTEYTGVSDLGIIAGAGMLVALVLNLTLLPGLIALMRPKGEPRPVGFTWAAPIDRFLVRRRVPVMVFAGLIIAVSAFLLPKVRFDFNPLNLQSPASESVAAMFDLMADPMTTPYVINILEPSPAVAAALADRIGKLPEVFHAVTVSSFVPDDQDAKLAILADAKTLLGPTLNPAEVKPPPSDAEILAAIKQCDDAVKKIVRNYAEAERLVHTLDGVLARKSGALPLLKANLADGIGQRLDDIRLALDARKVTLGTLPHEIKGDWVTADGHALVQVFPKVDARDNKGLRRFVHAVTAIAPEATGSPVTIQESAKTVIRAFITAGIIAVVAISLLLLVALRRPLDVALVIGPLLLAAIMTLATAGLFNIPLNYANIIALPLLLGVGVSFDVYFVIRWRSGTNELLQSSTARAILFSALTTGTAFGSLALSNHPGTAEMGKLLSMALGYTLFCTFLILPAVLSAVRKEE